MLATTRELADKHNLTYRQARYLIDQGVINPAPAKGGRAWAVSDETLWLLDLAASMRNEKIGIETIKRFVDQIRKWFGPGEGTFTAGHFGEDKLKDNICVVWNKPNWFVYTGIDAVKMFYGSTEEIEGKPILVDRAFLHVEAPGKQ